MFLVPRCIIDMALLRSTKSLNGTYAINILLLWSKDRKRAPQNVHHYTKLVESLIALPQKAEGPDLIHTGLEARCE
jgi:hypothetical protein